MVGAGGSLKTPSTLQCVKRTPTTGRPVVHPNRSKQDQAPPVYIPWVGGLAVPDFQSTGPGFRWVLIPHGKQYAHRRRFTSGTSRAERYGFPT